jgi:8-oxo-dGTP pyrophosphatase MutT (NUDIX family)
VKLDRLGAHVPTLLAWQGGVPSAVLVPILPHPDGHQLLLGRRGEHLASHGGQICFPGGRLEPDDPDLVTCALREAHEEVGIEAREVEVLGQLDDHVTTTGYRITPVVGLLRTDRIIAPTSEELVSVHRIALAELVRRTTWSRETVHEGAAMRIVQEVFHVDGHRVWGATARIVQGLLKVISA